MKKWLCLLLLLFVLSYRTSAQEKLSNKALAQQILSDSRLDTVQARALRLLTGFTAGTSYGEIWIRDFNTFIRGSLKVRKSQDVREILLLFFRIQGKDLNVPDGAIDKSRANVGYDYLYSDLAPGWAIHKNTVETDQESSLIQAVKKYVTVTSDKTILEEKVGELTVMERMEGALNYVLRDRWSAQYGLVKGATTVDWGDVQPQQGWGIVINEKTKWALDIYDNAMFLSAVHNLIALKPAGYSFKKDWKAVAASLEKHIRRYLWDSKAAKYIPHVYLDGSPFPPTLDEQKILYTGGTTCAILAGLHTPKEIKEINRQFVATAAKEPFATIGITVYPPYTLEAFPNMAPYTYQNGGDWTWFGGRMIEALALHGMANEAYTELSPMVERVIKNNGFYEWYDVRTGKASGSGDFRGEAGVLYDAIAALRAWARSVR